MTERDRRIFALLVEHFTFTTSQLAVLAGFGSLWRARHRLALLHSRGVLHRERPFRAGGGSHEWHWMLGPIGAKIVAAETGTAAVRPARITARWAKLYHGWRYRELMLQHDWFCQLAATAEAGAGGGLVEWVSPWRISRTHRATTDGYGRWRNGDGRELAFVLLLDDPPRVGTRELTDRLTSIDIARHDRDAGRLGAAVVLVWCHTLHREGLVRRRLQRHLGLSEQPVALACGEYADTPHGGGPHGRVWIPLGGLTTGSAGRVTLREITNLATTAAETARPAEPAGRPQGSSRSVPTAAEAVDAYFDLADDAPVIEIDPPGWWHQPSTRPDRIA